MSRSVKLFPPFQVTIENKKAAYSNVDVERLVIKSLVLHFLIIFFVIKVMLTVITVYIFHRVDFVKYPGLAQVEYHYVEMQPGDCLYIPYGW